LKLLFNPVVFILSFLMCALILIAGSRRKPWAKKAGFFLIVMATVAMYLFSIRPVSNLLAYSLESRYGPPSKKVLSNLDIIVILGGGFLPSDVFRECPEASGATYSRLFNGVEIFKQSGAKTLVLSGTCPWAGSGESDAEIMKGLAVKLGVSESRIITEAKSRNTMEHVMELAKLFPPDKKTRIGIVTSAMHMLRSERAFRKKFAKDDIVPIPVGYFSYPPDCAFYITSFVPSADNLAQSGMAFHELIGMIWYFLRRAV
jgi:uncharacterized SAM-binding protein YcdF (DUF218 family)